MLIKREYTNNKKSIYTCDICNMKMTVDDINKISRQKKKKNQKIYDLCEECYELFISAVKKLRRRRKKKMNKEIRGKEICGLDYEAEYNKMQEKICYMKEEYEMKMRDKEQLWQQVIDVKDKEIKWLKSVVSGILHIK